MQHSFLPLVLGGSTAGSWLWEDPRPGLGFGTRTKDHRAVCPKAHVRCLRCKALPLTRTSKDTRRGTWGSFHLGLHTDLTSCAVWLRRETIDQGPDSQKIRLQKQGMMTRAPHPQGPKCPCCLDQITRDQEQEAQRPCTST